MRFDFVCTQSHFAEHMRPVYEALPKECRGKFITRRPAGKIDLEEFAVVASISDLYRVHKKHRAIYATGTELVSVGKAKVALFEHGAGYTFIGSTRSSSYAGGQGRSNVSILPAVNRWVQAANAKYYPRIPGPIVGSPKMDKVGKIRRRRKEKPVVCVSFHWDCKIANETRWALPHFLKALPDLGKTEEFEVIGHGHPRHWRSFERIFSRAGIEPVSSFEQVCKRADLYVNDSSSTIFEFAATGRPVVVLNAPWYRRQVSHGLRFWDYADVGVNVDGPGDLLPGIVRALEDSEEQQARRREAVAEVYPHRGRSAERAAAVLLDWAERNVNGRDQHHGKEQAA